MHNFHPSSREENEKFPLLENLQVFTGQITHPTQQNNRMAKSH